MDQTHKRSWLMAAILFAICMTVYMLSELVIHPQSTLMALGGDAGKNYLSYFYHCLYDKGIWYTGMNYPYGEHIVYSDGQGLLSIPLSYINAAHHLNRSTLLMIMNLFIDISYVVGIVYTYKTLVHFKLMPWLAIIFAGLIISLSPQVLRIASHYALANMCFIPMLFYWSVKYHEQRKIRYIIYLFLLGSIMSFHHPYFGALMFIWIAMYTAGYWLLYRTSIQDKVRQTLPPILCVVAVFMVMQIFIRATDPMQDRPVYPYGALQTVTEFPLIVTSSLSPFWKFIAKHTNASFADGNEEGYIYVGLAAGIVFIISFVIGIIRLAKKQKSTIDSTGGFPAIWLFVAFGTLVLALGIPFVWGMEGLYEHMSVMRQFRALGRFGWIFYYIITVYAAVKIHQWYAAARRDKKTIAAWAILLIPILVWARESKAYMKHTRHMMLSGYYNYSTLFGINQESWEDFLAKTHHQGSDIQGIILLPFMHIGSEKLWVHENEGWLITLGAKAALQLHLPIVNVMMSRTSLSQTEKQVRIVGGPFADKPLLRDMKSHKPFMVLHFENDSLDVDQKYILRNSEFLGDYSQGHIYLCYPDKLLASDKRYTDSALSIAHSMPPGTDSCVRPNGSWYINHMDSGKATQRLFGTGAALPLTGGDKEYLAQIPIKPAYADQLYEFSIWMLVQSKDFRDPEILIDMLDSSGKVLAQANLNTKESVDNQELWFRTSDHYKIPEHTTLFRCRVVPTKYPCYFAMDEMLLRPEESLIISKAVDGKVMANNHLLVGAH